MRSRHRLILLTLLWIFALGLRDDGGHLTTSTAERLPNVIIVYADDLGYADIASFSTRTGASRPSTPNLDRMAARARRSKAECASRSSPAGRDASRKDRSGTSRR